MEEKKRRSLYNIDVGKNLKRLRTRAKLSQRQLVTQLYITRGYEISRSSYDNVENNRYQFTGQLFLALHEFYTKEKGMVVDFEDFYEGCQTELTNDINSRKVED